MAVNLLPSSLQSLTENILAHNKLRSAILHEGRLNFVIMLPAAITVDMYTASSAAVSGANFSSFDDLRDWH